MWVTTYYIGCHVVGIFLDFFWGVARQLETGATIRLYGVFGEFTLSILV